MVDTHADRPTEIDLEMDQRARLMALFSCVEKFDDRDSVITFCENIVRGQQKD